MSLTSDAPTAMSAASPSPPALLITDVWVVEVERDPLRENGAIVALQVEYSGGRSPYTLYHEDTLQPNNPFKVLATCKGKLVHTLRLTAGDGQSTTKRYLISPVNCPP